MYLPDLQKMHSAKQPTHAASAFSTVVRSLVPCQPHVGMSRQRWARLCDRHGTLEIRSSTSSSEHAKKTEPIASARAALSREVDERYRAEDTSTLGFAFGSGWGCLCPHDRRRSIRVRLCRANLGWSHSSTWSCASWTQTRT